ncbi:periplasmic binding protein-like I [Globomyces pollinis-pini]|nr:periplasmic binding protein-like I [Globomyces pollinis-pini]
MKSTGWFITALLSLGLALSPNGTHKIKIGISLGYLPGATLLLNPIQAVMLRINQLNEKSDLLGDDTALEYISLNHLTARDVTIVNALELQKQGVVAVIGSGYSSLAMLTSLVLQNYNIPQCDIGTNPSLSNKKQYPNFFRTIPTDASQGAAMVGYMAASGWSKIAIIHTNEDYGTGLANFVNNYARDYNITVLAKVMIQLGTTPEATTPSIATIKESGARIILYAGYVEEYIAAITMAKKLGIYGPDYVWLGSEALKDMGGVYPESSDLYSGTLTFYPREASGPEAPGFADYWVTHGMNTGFEGYNLTSPKADAAYVYFQASCVDLFLHGFDALLKSNSSYTISDLAAGKLNKKMLVPQTFQFPEVATPSGYIKSDANGDRIGDFDIYNFVGSELKLVGAWENEKKVMLPDVKVVYPGGLLVQPKDGIDPNDVAVYAAPGSSLGIISVVFFAIGILTTLTSVLLTLKYRAAPAIRKSSINIGFAMQLIVLLVNFQFLIMIDKPTRSSCTIDSVIIPVAFSAYYGLLFAKNLRIYRIFYKPHSNFKLPDLKIYGLGILFACPSIVLVAIWNAIDPPIPTIVMISMTQYYRTCQSVTSLGDTITTLLLVYNGIILVCNLYMAVKTRNVASTYNETKLIGFSVYNMTIIGLFGTAVLLSDSLGFSAKYTIKIVAVFYILMFNLATSFLAKIYQAMTGSADGTKNGSSMGTSSKKSNNAGGEAGKKGTVNQAEVTVRKLNGFDGFFGEARNMIMSQMSDEIVMMHSLKKVSMESKETKETGEGQCWNLRKLSKLVVVAKDTTTRNISIDGNSYEFRFMNEEDAAAWSVYFEKWVFRVNASATGTGMGTKSM